MEESKIFQLDEDLVSSAMVKDDCMYVSFGLNDIKNYSKLFIGEKRMTSIPVDQHFNWFQKLMWKLCFGVKIKEYNEE